MQTNLAPILLNGNPLFYQGAPIPERAILGIAPEAPETLSAHFGSGLMRETIHKPRDVLPFTPDLRYFTDDSLSFGGYKGANFLMRNPK